jgi:hypothetical protein
MRSFRPSLSPDLFTTPRRHAWALVIVVGRSQLFEVIRTIAILALCTAAVLVGLAIGRIG